MHHFKFATLNFKEEEMSCATSLRQQNASISDLGIDNKTLLELIYQRVLYVNDLNNIHENAIIGDGAILTGDVRVGAHTVIFNQTLLQADKAPISIGEGCCIVDGIIMHNCVEIGNYVHIAHGCIIHRRRTTGCLRIGSGTLVGFGSQVHENIGKGCQIAPGVIIDQPIPDYHFVYAKNMGKGLRQMVVSPMRTANYERVVQMYKSFWGRSIVYKGNLVPLTWKTSENAKDSLTFDEAVKNLKSHFNHRLSP
jgi:carbonic anhydrase/acetyltransferase-like protein (isoleucine patch superfamily)